MAALSSMSSEHGRQRDTTEPLQDEVSPSSMIDFQDTPVDIADYSLPSSIQTNEENLAHLRRRKFGKEIQSGPETRNPNTVLGDLNKQHQRPRSSRLREKSSSGKKAKTRDKLRSIKRISRKKGLLVLESSQKRRNEASTENLRAENLFFVPPVIFDEEPALARPRKQRKKGQNIFDHGQTNTRKPVAPSRSPTTPRPRGFFWSSRQQTIDNFAPSSVPKGNTSREPDATTQPSQPNGDGRTPSAMQLSNEPSIFPSMQPSQEPAPRSVSGQPSHVPSSRPSAKPSTKPSSTPSVEPTPRPTNGASEQPSAIPLAIQPSSTPSVAPSPPAPEVEHSLSPTVESSQPSSRPINASEQPSAIPLAFQPSSTPSVAPSPQTPAAEPSLSPTVERVKPSVEPTSSPEPSLSPTVESGEPSARPTKGDSGAPSSTPSFKPSS